MANVSLIKYPIDVTGISPDNKIVNERHDVSALDRSIVPRQGYFYGESLVIIRNDKPLKLGTDYRIVDMNEELTKFTGKAVMGAIELLDSTAIGTVTITYQAYGSGDNYSRQYIADLVKEATATQIVSWDDVLEKPDAFPPTPHRHPIVQTYGWRASVLLLQDLIQIVSNWRLYRDSTIYARLNEYQNKVNAALEDYRLKVEAATAALNTIIDFELRFGFYKEEVAEKFQQFETAIDNSLTEIRNDYNQKNNDRVAEINELERILNVVRNTTIPDINKRIAANTTLINKTKNDLTSELNKYKKFVSDTYVLKTTYNGFVSAISGRVKTNEDDIAALKRLTDTHTAEITELKKIDLSPYWTADRTLSEIKKYVNPVKSDLDSTKNKLNNTTSTANAANSKADGNATAINDLKNSFNQKVTDLINGSNKFVPLTSLQSSSSDYGTNKIPKYSGSKIYSQGYVFKKGSFTTTMVADDVRNIVTLDSIFCPVSFLVSSDRRVKKNITLVKNALEIVSELEGVYFTYKQNEFSTAGVIAQDVQEHFPVAVKEDMDGNLTVDYNALSSLFIESIKSLKEENQQMRDELSAIKAQLGML